jgi:6-phospho-beta-glucosidase
MTPKVITVVGGGAFTPQLCEALARTVELPELELRLSARRPDRLGAIASHSAARVARAQPGWSVRAADSLEAAVAGAAIVVLLIRVGGLEARAWDETFPRQFGLAGDEGLGPGGIANAWRTVPELSRISGTLRRIAPEAKVLNLMAPLGITTRLLLDQGLDALGLCELPLLTLETWLARARKLATETTWEYAGLNHLGWFWNFRSGDDDILLRLAGLRPQPGDAAPLDRATLERYQAAPLRYFYQIFETETARRLGLERPPGRARQLMTLSDELVTQFARAPGLETPQAGTRPTPWLDRAVAPITAALLGGPTHAGFANLLNKGKIPELPTDLVVEVPATFGSGGVRPEKAGPLPSRVSHFLTKAGYAEALSFRAAQQRDPTLLAAAVRALPLPIPEAAIPELVRLIQGGVER